MEPIPWCITSFGVTIAYWKSGTKGTCRLYADCTSSTTGLNWDVHAHPCRLGCVEVVVESSVVSETGQANMPLSILTSSSHPLPTLPAPLGGNPDLANPVWPTRH